MVDRRGGVLRQPVGRPPVLAARGPVTGHVTDRVDIAGHEGDIEGRVDGWDDVGEDAAGVAVVVNRELGPSTCAPRDTGRHE